MLVTEGLCGTVLVCTSLRTGRGRASGVRSEESFPAKHGGKAAGKAELGEVDWDGRIGSVLPVTLHVTALSRSSSVK